VTTHLREQELLRFQRQLMAADELLLTDRHLSACTDCAQGLAALAELPGAVTRIQRELAQAEGEPCAYFSYEQKADYVNGHLGASELALAKVHLAQCGECCLGLAELQAVQQSLTPKLAGIPKRRKAWEGWRVLFEVPTTRWFWRGLGTVATAALLVWFGAPNWRGRETPQPAQLSAPPTSTPNQRNAEGRPNAPAPAATQEIPALSASGPKIVLQDAGQQVALDAANQLLGLEALSLPVQTAVKDALVTQQIKVSSQLIRMRAATVELLGKGREATDFILLSPVGQVVPSTQPILKWQALSGASSYFVSIYDANLRKVASSGALAVTEWKPALQLERGRSYYWQVRALRDEQEFFAPAPSAPDAKFKVLERAQFAEIEQTKTARNSHLALGVLYARAGMLEEAGLEFKALAAANPHSPVAKQILQNFERQNRSVRP
jgi:hypothetical protein